MYIDTEIQSKLQPYVLFDWRLIAERGLRCYGHFHQWPNSDLNTVASCEISFLIKMSADEQNQGARNQFDTNNDLLGFNKTTAQNNNEKYSSPSLNSQKRAGQLKCVGAIRKAGFLSVKKWILKRKQSIELARKQGWKKYWVCLRGTALLFHSIVDKGEIDLANENDVIDLLSWASANCCGQLHIISDPTQQQSEHQHLDGLSQFYIEEEPRHLIIIDGSIAQPIPEHPKREFVFCLSTTFGDAYLFQASCQLESDNWILAIHNACAATIARDLTRDEAIKLFETKLRHLELDSEKKLFLRQRLDSRLTSMSSMSHVASNSIFEDPNFKDLEQTCDQKALEDLKSKRTTMKTLLYRLSQQLHAFDAYLEQIHCEIYQLRCYLFSCNAQKAFYLISPGNLKVDLNHPTTLVQSTIDLPHPKSLLIHVSKPTKLLLIKLGVFTVSSFHAYVHARQDSAETILKKITQQTNQQSNDQTFISPTLQLNVRSRSFSESFMTIDSSEKNAKLEKDAENLIQISNIKQIEIRISKQIYYKLTLHNYVTIQSHQMEQTSDNRSNDVSDDRYSIEEQNSYVTLKLKVQSSLDSMSVIVETLNILKSVGASRQQQQHQQQNDLEFLDYSLRLAQKTQSTAANLVNEHQKSRDFEEESFLYRLVRRKETVNDWLDCNHLELFEKIIFRLDVPRSRVGEKEEALPFGISIEGQLISSKTDCVLNVYCSYVEWGSVADKAGLKDEDELLMVNGIPVADLDMMFVECVIKDGTKLRLVVRSSREKAPPGSALLDPSTWRRPSDEGGEGGDDDKDLFKHPDPLIGQSHQLAASGSQIISDEYISSLVCPPPPTPSSAFLRTDLVLVRQKSNPDRDFVSTGVTASDDGKNLDDLITQSQPAIRANSSHLSKKKFNGDSKSPPSARQKFPERPDKSNRIVIDGTSNQSLQDASTKTLISRPSDSLQDRSTEDRPMMERLKKSLTELLETEYAYVRHLETIIEHYMNPLEEMAFLNIPQLKELNKITVELKKFQKQFFDKLVHTISTSLRIDLTKSSTCDVLELLNQVLHQLDRLNSGENFKPLLESLAELFLVQSDGFKQYTSYCVSYSKLQKLLHLRENGPSGFNQNSNIVSIPPTLNKFSNSNGLNISTSSIGTQLFRPLSGSFSLGGSHNEFYTQLKQLNEFLGNLDSSSSSASLSFPKSSSCSENPQQQTAGNNKKTTKLATPNRASCSSNNISNSSNNVGNSNTTSIVRGGVHQQNLESYLIKPIQRIVKYPMLLNLIASCSVQMMFEDGERVYNELQIANKKLESVISHVNNTQRTYDEYGHIFNLIERQYLELQAGESSAKAFSNSLLNSVLVKPHQPPISLDASQLLHAGLVDWLNVQDFTYKVKRGMNLVQSLFVFSSCVVFICKDIVKTTKRRRQLLDSMSGLGQSSSNSIVAATTTTMATTATTNAANNSTTSMNTNRPINQQSEQSTEIIRFQTLIPVSEVQVRSVQRTPGVDSKQSSTEQFQWELFHCSPSNPNSSLLTKAAANKRVAAGKGSSNNSSGKVYLLASASSEDRNAFLRKIRFIIRESVRNMSLPLARSPSTKSCITSKKLSSPSSNNNTTNSSCSHSTSLSPTNSNSCEQQQEQKFTDAKKGQENGTNATTTTTANSTMRQRDTNDGTEFRFASRQKVNSDNFTNANTVKVNN